MLNVVDLCCAEVFLVVTPEIWKGTCFVVFPVQALSESSGLFLSHPCLVPLPIEISVLRSWKRVACRITLCLTQNVVLSAVYIHTPALLWTSDPSALFFLPAQQNSWWGGGDGESNPSLVAARIDVFKYIHQWKSELFASLMNSSFEKV